MEEIGISGYTCEWVDFKYIIEGNETHLVQGIVASHFDAQGSAKKLNYRVVCRKETVTRKSTKC